MSKFICFKFYFFAISTCGLVSGVYSSRCDYNSYLHKVIIFDITCYFSRDIPKIECSKTIDNSAVITSWRDPLNIQHDTNVVLVENKKIHITCESPTEIEITIVYNHHNNGSSIKTNKIDISQSGKNAKHSTDKNNQRTVEILFKNPVYFEDLVNSINNIKIQHKNDPQKYLMLIPSSEYLVIWPPTDKIVLHGFYSSTLAASCSSHSQISIERVSVPDGKNIFDGDEVRRWNGIFAYNHGIFFANAEVTKLPLGSAGYLICFKTIFSGGTSQKEVLHTWAYLVQDLRNPPAEDEEGLTIQDDGLSICLHLKKPSFEFQHSIVNMQCSSQKHCDDERVSACLKEIFQPKPGCNLQTRYGSIARNKKYKSGMYKSVIERIFSNGWIRCGNFQPVVYFTAFDGVKYNHWSEVKNFSNILSLEMMKDNITDIHLNKSESVKLRFRCRVHKFLSEDGITWELIHLNGTKITPLDRDISRISDSKTEDSDATIIEELTLMNATSEPQKVYCIVTPHDSNSSLNVSLTLKQYDDREVHTDRSSSSNNMKNNSIDFEISSRIMTSSLKPTSWNISSERLPSLNSSTFQSNQTIHTIASSGTRSHSSIGNSWKMWILLGLAFICLLVASVAFFLIYRRRRNKSRENNFLSKEEIRNFYEGRKVRNSQFTDVTAPFNASLSIPKDHFKFNEQDALGVGHFGIPYLKGELEGGFENVVAVKILNGEVPTCNMRSLLMELKILNYLNHHPNVVELKGAFVDEIKDGVLYVALEYCPSGNLLQFLKDHREHFIDSFQGIVKDTTRELNHQTPLNFDCLVRWGLNIANAMEYLKRKNVIHCDMALRNVLLSSDLVAKLTNFGVAQNLTDDAYAICVKLPANDTNDSTTWKWMAIESLTDHIFTYKSEVWSFGVALWELFNLGLTPFPGVKCTNEFLKGIEDGRIRLGLPQLSPCQGVYDSVMVKCWEINPDDRLDIETIQTILPTFVSKHKNYISLV